MTDWVFNKLTIEGDVSPVQMFKHKIATPYDCLSYVYDSNLKESSYKMITNDEILSFWNIKRPPADKMGLYSARSDGTEDKTWGWYHWNPTNWGTKWDACNPEIIEELNNKIVYHFDTAWDSPNPVMFQASEDYPDLTIRLDYTGEEGWGGFYILKAGKVLETKNWEAPTSHEGFKDLEQDCWCVSNEDYAPFKDCPNYQED